LWPDYASHAQPCRLSAGRGGFAGDGPGIAAAVPVSASAVRDPGPARGIPATTTVLGPGTTPGIPATADSDLCASAGCAGSSAPATLRRPVISGGSAGRPVSFQAAAPAGQSSRQTLKRVFAGTLATVAQATGTSLALGLTQVITGGLTEWFSRKSNVPPGVVPAAQVFPQAPAVSPPPPVPSTPPLPPEFLPPPAGTPGPPPQEFLPPPSAAAQQAPPPVFANTAPAPPPQFFDAQTGAATAPDPALAAAFAAPAESRVVFAGLAYEVHTVGANGATIPVDPATHEFRTGDRFVVFYRPTLPGQLDVINVNPAGRRTQIDRVDLAAGQLAQLGPYEFAALKGDEQLKLVLTPCQTPALIAATRDIINVSSASTAAPTFALAECSPATRSVRQVQTRDIRRVAVEGTTGFALDAVSPAEFSSGQVTPREVTITFRHR
jgi:hypothetical protein